VRDWNRRANARLKNAETRELPPRIEPKPIDDVVRMSKGVPVRIMFNAHDSGDGWWKAHYSLDPSNTAHFSHHMFTATVEGSRAWLSTSLNWQMLTVEEAEIAADALRHAANWIKERLAEQEKNS
jgi:hypothetical protein